ncbi:collagen alpha-1(I) chain-like [Phalacrocorax carbo]|uniref:collagen alpha-1(I) chain-like n=1 Tax=Phalacrocorax carbo TaxID=9209 RepID=UPI003119DAD0
MVLHRDPPAVPALPGPAAAGRGEAGAGGNGTERERERWGARERGRSWEEGPARLCNSCAAPAAAAGSGRSRAPGPPAAAGGHPRLLAAGAAEAAARHRAGVGRRGGRAPPLTFPLSLSQAAAGPGAAVAAGGARGAAPAVSAWAGEVATAPGCSPGHRGLVPNAAVSSTASAAGAGGGKRPALPEVSKPRAVAPSPRGAEAARPSPHLPSDEPEARGTCAPCGRPGPGGQRGPPPPGGLRFPPRLAAAGYSPRAGSFPPPAADVPAEAAGRGAAALRGKFAEVAHASLPNPALTFCLQKAIQQRG